MNIYPLYRTGWGLGVAVSVVDLQINIINSLVRRDDDVICNGGCNKCTYSTVTSVTIVRLSIISGSNVSVT